VAEKIIEAVNREAFTAESFDNSKNPVACFEGPRSIFRGHGEKPEETVGKEVQRANS
jgi:hypothetical protein